MPFSFLGQKMVVQTRKNNYGFLTEYEKQRLLALQGIKGFWNPMMALT